MILKSQIDGAWMFFNLKGTCSKTVYIWGECQKQEWAVRESGQDEKGCCWWGTNWFWKKVAVESVMEVQCCNGHPRLLPDRVMPLADAKSAIVLVCDSPSSKICVSTQSSFMTTMVGLCRSVCFCDYRIKAILQSWAATKFRIIATVGVRYSPKHTSFAYPLRLWSSWCSALLRAEGFNLREILYTSRRIWTYQRVDELTIIGHWW